jgi:hypothetical protein
MSEDRYTEEKVAETRGVRPGADKSWSHHELEEQEGVSPRTVGGSTALQHLDFRLLASRTVRINSHFWSSWCEALCYTTCVRLTCVLYRPSEVSGALEDRCKGVWG